MVIAPVMIAHAQPRAAVAQEGEEPPLDVVEVSGQKIELRTQRELATYRYLTGEGKAPLNLDPRATQIASLEKDGCEFSTGTGLQAYYSPAPVIVMYNQEAVSELPAYTPPAVQLETPYDGTPQEEEYHRLLKLSRNPGLAARALEDAELRKMLEEMPRDSFPLMALSREPVADRELIAAAQRYPEAARSFRAWSEIEDRATFVKVLGTPELEHDHVEPAWSAITSDPEHAERRATVWCNLASRLEHPARATAILETYPQGDLGRPLRMLDRLLSRLPPEEATEAFQQAGGSESALALLELSRAPHQVERARQWLTREDLVDAQADPEERLATLAELARANRGDLGQAQRDYLFVASRSESWEQMQALSSFLINLTDACQDPREGRLAFAALELLPPAQAAPRADNLVKALTLAGTFAGARPAWTALLRLSPEDGAARLESLPALPHVDASARQRLLLGQLEQPLEPEAVGELASLLADPKLPACADRRQAGALVELAFSPQSHRVRQLFELCQGSSFTEAWALLEHGADDLEDARQAYALVKSEPALARVASARQPGEKLSDLARLYRGDGFEELAARIRGESQDVPLETVARALEKSARPEASWSRVSPPILAESLEERLAAYQALPPQSADALYAGLAGLLEVSDDLPRAALSLGSLARATSRVGPILDLIASRRAKGDLRRPLHGVFDAVGEALVRKGGGFLSHEEIDEALARGAVTGIRETGSHVLVGGVTLVRRQ